jgi:hypothetical protein
LRLRSPESKRSDTVAKRSLLEAGALEQGLEAGLIEKAVVHGVVLEL